VSHDSSKGRVSREWDLVRVAVLRYDDVRTCRYWIWSRTVRVSRHDANLPARMNRILIDEASATACWPDGPVIRDPGPQILRVHPAQTLRVELVGSANLDGCRDIVKSSRISQVVDRVDGVVDLGELSEPSYGRDHGDLGEAAEAHWILAERRRGLVR
jgi:hypothetical protein